MRMNLRNCESRMKQINTYSRTLNNNQLWNSANFSSAYNKNAKIFYGTSFLRKILFVHNCAEGALHFHELFKGSCYIAQWHSSMTCYRPSITFQFRDGLGSRPIAWTYAICLYFDCCKLGERKTNIITVTNVVWFVSGRQVASRDQEILSRVRPRAFPVCEVPSYELTLSVLRVSPERKLTTTYK
jgi:hypothetical protein